MTTVRQFKHVIAGLFLLGCLVSNAFSVDLVYLKSPAGTKLLLNADLNKQFFSLMPVVTTEEVETFCGPASMTSTLNSLQVKNRPVTPQFSPYPFFTQDSLFVEATEKIAPKNTVKTGGLTLD